jgi:photosystem II stability/assembly factor-like uncharacterized protein
MSVSASAAEWEPVATELLKTEKTGYGGLCGIVVDHSTGEVIINLSERGLFRSTDQCKTWMKRGPVIKGRTEWPGCMLFDPTGKSRRAMLALVYGAPIGVSADGGETWSQHDAKSSHVDWAVADWTDPDLKFILTLKHESGGLLLVSHDAGKSYADVAKGYGPAWIFDKQTAVAAELRSKDWPKPRIMRTVDGAKTWEPIAEHNATALPKWNDGTLYWLTDSALIATTDQGKSWKKLSDVKDGLYGPVFGKDGKQQFLLTKAGVVESTDGGGSWSKPVALPKDLKGASALTWIEYDPKNDVLYVMKMGSDLYRMTRGK